MNLEKLGEYTSLLGQAFLMNEIVKVLKNLQKRAEDHIKLMEYYEKYPIHSWLAQKIYYFGW